MEALQNIQFKYCIFCRASMDGAYSYGFVPSNMRLDLNRGQKTI
jgi:hypothetical protein